IYTHTSAAVTLTVSAVKVKPTITSNPEGAALTGNTVTLYCKLHQSAGWTFYWSKHTQSSEKETITNVYTISSVSLSDGGQYWCRAGRGNPVYYTHYSDALWVNVTDSTKAVVSIKPDKQVFKGETVTLRCDIQAGGDTEWTYSWYKDDHLSSNRRTQEFTVSSVTESNGDVAQAVLSVSAQSWLTEGESVTLSCEVTGSSTGWTFSWYRAALYRQGLEQIRDVHDKVLYHVELLSDSRREVEAPTLSVLLL
ncbi:leukocyte immunoglobulin-like receptor subfamily A member 1, partial [Pygocentrus nattereri]|uniref:leukocyte immunoglobulin-like receptor subfamily A member 1 n=1 Tax=Pygocentrus nattereri TaxID=42514 RepID=UPI001890D1BF